jgi:transglutaminase-like putative cysteine protease
MNPPLIHTDGSAIRHALPLLGTAIAMMVVPHVADLPWDIPAWVCLAVLVRWAIQCRWIPEPSRLWLLLAVITGVILIYFHFHKFHGREAGVALFLVGLGLKLLELRSRRDLYLAVYLTLFGAVTHYLFSQSIAIFAYTLFVLVLLVACLIRLNGGELLTPRNRLCLAGSLLAQAIPVTVVLFLFVPRVAGPLWRLPQDDRSERTGLSDFLEPGAISRLGATHETAFRVDFEGEPPPPRRRYWRGPVFWHFDGRRWTVGAEPISKVPTEPVREGGKLYRYTVTLEPHQRRWVFPLEFPESVPAELTLLRDGYLLAAEPLRERRRFVLSSRPGLPSTNLPPQEKNRALQLPAPPDSRVQELVNGWQSDHSSAELLAQRILDHFHTQPFVYTLKPPPLYGDPIAGFLFETRRGFCEHFASTFVYLMRVAGIPARLVTGYQGGHWNPVGKFLEIEQADAHAWAEIWVEERGWLRIDPTAAVAPERIERELEFAGVGNDGTLLFMDPVAHTLDESQWSATPFLRRADWLWSAVDHAWTRWVLAYGPEMQMRFLRWLDITEWHHLIPWLGGLLGGLALVFLGLFWPFQYPPTEPALHLYRRVTRRLERGGLVRHPAEGMRDFALRVAAVRPDIAVPFERFTQLFLEIRYGRRHQADALRRLRDLAKPLFAPGFLIRAGRAASTCSPADTAVVSNKSVPNREPTEHSLAALGKLRRR